MKTISSGDSPSKLNILINSLKEPFILNPCNFVFDEMPKKCKNCDEGITCCLELKEIKIFSPN